MSSKNVLKFRQRRKENLVKLFGNECCLCGYHKSLAALDFHHIKPEDKKFGLSTGNCHCIEDDIAEAKKCILVCANCHREIHNGFYQDVDLFQYQKIDSKFEDELLYLKKQEEYFCSDCGKKITQYSRSGLCSSCVQRLKNKNFVLNKPNREELKKLIRNLPFVQIGQQYGVTDNAVRKWCDKMNLPKTKKEINSYSDEQWAKI